MTDSNSDLQHTIGGMSDDQLLNALLRKAGPPEYDDQVLREAVHRMFVMVQGLQRQS